MKKIVRLLLLLIIVVPIMSYATCDGEISGGGSTGFGGVTHCEGNCCNNGATCLHNWDNMKGIRFQLYVVKSKTDVTLLGKGVDVWNAVPTGGTTYTKPTNNNLKTKLNCSAWPATYQAALNERSTLTISGEQYFSGNYGRIIKNPGVGTTSNINDWSFTYDDDTNTPTGGYLKGEFFDYLMAGDFEKAGEFFNLSADKDGVNEFTVLKNAINDGNAFITAEVLYCYINSSTGTDHFGTVSENAHLHSCSVPMQWLITKKAANIYDTEDPDSRGLTPKYMNKVYVHTGDETFGSYGYYTATHADKAACNYAYGWTSWNIKDVCKTCGGCDQECGYAKKGTAGRAACAVAFCNKREPDNKTNCINQCTSVPEDQGCVPEEEKTCDDYKDSSYDTELSCKNFNTAERDGLTATVKKEVCYDADNYKGDITEASYKVGGLRYGVKYYKIKCEDTLKLSSLPSKQTPYYSSVTSTNLHFSYKAKRNVSCNIVYRTSDKYRKKSGKENVYWISMPSNATDARNNLKVYEDYDSVSSSLDGAKKRKEEIEKGSYAESTKNEMLEIQNNTITYLEQMQKDLGNTIKISKERLNSLTSKSNNSDQLTENVVLLKVVEDDLNNVTEEIVLKPIACTVDDVINKCLVNGLTGTGSTDKVVTCDDTVGKITTSTDGTKSSFEETIMYSFPDSYVAAHNELEGTIYNASKSDCDGAVASSNGFCKVLEYTFALSPYEGDNKSEYIQAVKSLEGKLQLKVTSGLCDELKFKYNCDYELIDDYCEECEGLTGDLYAECAAEKCGCDYHCGSNQVCRFKYCPIPCVGCGWEDTCDACHEACSKYANDKNSKGYVTCYYDACCSSQCDGDCACTLNCCRGKCDTLYEDNAGALSTCYKECDTYIKCGGDDPAYPNFKYHTTPLDNPFPDRKEIGNNWYNKTDLISKADLTGTEYYDSTNGFHKDQYEYMIEFDTDTLKEIKKNVDTYYKSFGKTKHFYSTKGENTYCSSFIYEELEKLGAEVTVDPSSYNCQLKG